MRLDEFLAAFANKLSFVSNEVAVVQAYGQFRPMVWQVAIRRGSDLHAVATFDLDVGGKVVNMRPLPDARVGDWEKVREVLGLT